MNKNFKNFIELYKEANFGNIIIYFNLPGYPYYFINEQLLNLLGYDNESDIKNESDKFFINLVHPKDRDLVQTNSEETNLEYRIKKKDDSYLYFLAYSKKVIDEEKNEVIISNLIDITSLKQREEAIKKTKKEYTMALKGAGISVWEYDVQNNRLLQSRGSKNLHKNYDNIIEDVPNHFIENSMIEKSDWDAYLNMYKKIKEGVPYVSGDFWVTDEEQNGWWREHISYTVECDENNKPIIAYGASRNITLENIEKKRYEAENFLSENYSSSIIASTRVNLSLGKVDNLYYFSDKEFNPSYRNCIDYKERSKGYLKENYINEKDYNDLSAENLIKKFRNGEKIISKEYQGRWLDGEYVFIKVDVKLFYKPNSLDIMAFFYNRDVTKEVILKSSVDMMMNKKYEGIVYIDLYKDKYISLVSNKNIVNSMNITGCYSQGLLKFFEKSDNKRNEEKINENLTIESILEKIKFKNEYSLDIVVVDSKNCKRLKHINISALNLEAGLVIITIEDIEDLVKEEKRKQEELKTALKAANAANEAKSEFLARVSHDLRTPLNVIMGLSDLGSDLNTVEECKDYLNKINKSGRYLLSLINDTLDVNKIESNTIKPTFSIINSKKLAGLCVNEATELAKVKGVTFITDTKTMDNVYIKTDVVKIKQIISNLLSNAIKFTPKGGTVKLIHNCIKRIDNIAYYETTIKDTGIGMDEEFLEKLYEPFVQENAEILPQYEGSGLGMTIVKKLVELLGGEIEVKSEKGKGTEFTFFLSYEIIKEYKEEENGEEQIEKLANKNILLCEDHPINREITTKLLEKKGCKIDCARNGKEGVEKFINSPTGHYNAILMDVRMPIMNGIEATRAIRNSEHQDSAIIPIIAVTANAYESDVKDTIDAGMNSFITKPIAPAKLYSTIAKFV